MAIVLVVVRHDDECKSDCGCLSRSNPVHSNLTLAVGGCAQIRYRPSRRQDAGNVLSLAAQTVRDALELRLIFSVAIYIANPLRKQSVDFVSKMSSVLTAQACGPPPNQNAEFHFSLTRKLCIFEEHLSRVRIPFLFLLSNGIHNAHTPLHRKLIPIPNCRPFRPSSPFLMTSGKEKFSSKRAAG